MKVADFGIAKILGGSSTTTHMVGTAHYMAPEFISNNTLSPSVDVYALGVSLYQTLTGQLPFGTEQDNPYAVAQRHLQSIPAMIPGLDKRVWDLISGMLTKRSRSGRSGIRPHPRCQGRTGAHRSGRSVGTTCDDDATSTNVVESLS